MSELRASLHDSLRVPENGVSVKCGSWIEPEMELLLLVTFPLRIYIGVDCVRLPRHIPQEFKVDFIVPFSQR